MMRLLNFIITGIWNPHEHFFVIKEEFTIRERGVTAIIGKIYISQCQGCGKIYDKKINLNGFN